MCLLKLYSDESSLSGLDYQFHGIKNKLDFIIEFCDKEKIDLSEIAYIGDDINCYDLLSNVGIAACPKNAIQKIKAR